MRARTRSCLSASLLTLVCAVLASCGNDPTTPAPDCTLSGTVVDVTGTPIRGALIAHALAPNDGVEAILDWRGGTQTDAEGAYEVVLPAADLTHREGRPVLLHVQATGAGFVFQVPAAATVWVTRGAQTATAPQLRLLRAGALKGRVVDSAGIGVPEQQVRIDHPAWARALHRGNRARRRVPRRCAARGPGRGHAHGG